MDIHNLDGLHALAVQLKQLGYTGMHLIHPSHVPVVNEVFSPSPEEVKHWQGLVAAMEEMRKTGGAAVTFDGDMVGVLQMEGFPNVRPACGWQLGTVAFEPRPVHVVATCSLRKRQV